ncbi:MAG: putative lipid II flippase FtsW [Candidatus Moranbacteria bacterium]|nr:putative lipid II flippase FtsW [Candidatus Moranbacteria bacterium]
MSQNQPDKKLLFTVFALIIFGLVMIASAGVVYSQTRFGDQYYFFKHQLFFGVIPGLVALYIFQKIDYHFWKKMATPFFILSLVLLVLVFVPGIGAKAYGASRWIQLGSFSFQPAEMMKLAIVLYLAAWLESRGWRKARDFFEGLLPFLVIMGAVGFLIIKQPNIGTLGVIILTSLTIYFIAGARLSHMISLISAGVLLLVVLVKIAPYRFSRFLVFLNPQLDPRGIGYQINQALLAIGSGGIFGLGLGHSRQKFNYLPEPTGDSIFAIIGEELGIIGAGLIILLFVALAFRGLKIAASAPDNFGRLAAGGVTAWIVIQAFVNISAITGIIPLTGIPLPFISYGGTSLMFVMAGVGILLNISKQAKMES